MIETIQLTTLKQFQELKKGDIIACEFKRNMYKGNTEGFTFGVFNVYDNKEFYTEIIIDKRWNLYFNYEMFLSGDTGSNLISAVLIKKL